MSSAGAECVRAPIEMRSTPVRARSATLSSVTPPETSSWTSERIFFLIATGPRISALGEVAGRRVLGGGEVGEQVVPGAGLRPPPKSGGFPAPAADDGLLEHRPPHALDD